MQDKSLRDYHAAHRKLGEATVEIERLRAQLIRANTIIGWMMPHIGVMAPPDGGLGDLNDHCIENKVPSPRREKCDRPIKQTRLG